MSFNLAVTLLLIALLALALWSLATWRLPAGVRKGLVLFSLIAVILLVAQARSEWGFHQQVKQQVKRASDVSSLLEKGNSFRWSGTREGERRGKSVKFTCFSIGTAQFVAVAEKSKSPYYWTPSYRVKALYREEGFEQLFQKAASNSMTSAHISGKSVFNSPYLDASITVYAEESLPQSERDRIVQNFTDEIKPEPGQPDRSLAYHIDFEFRRKSDEQLLAKAYKETGETTFTWADTPSPKPTAAR